ncbi:MAG: formylglycine-generating enzyme family protein, partial [Phycisphaerales bacterium]|nr:formylglycine-generating enzyme family protein [Phycisphaerales bacterium]
MRIASSTLATLAVLAVIGAGCEARAPAEPVVASTPDALAPDATAGVEATAENVDPQRIATPLVAIPAGTFRPLFGKEVGDVPVAAFTLERHAVTNGQFLAFVRAEPKWRRSRVKNLFADAQYLAHWTSDLDHGPDAAAQPVTRVSWFAARAYARWVGRRLPSVAEWEVAAADLDGGRDAITKLLLQWYSRPTPAVLPSVESTFATRAGVHDLHGLVWEWVDDFNSALVSGESRGDAGLERNLFCGSGSVGATDPSDYAA